MRFLRILAVLALLLVPLSTVPAHAAGESIKDLQVTYDVRADGTVRATYELDWDFGQKGKRGILFGLVIAEPWDLDPTQEARYTLSNFDVVSPTGAPTTYEETKERSRDGRLHTKLRIGDPDNPLDTTRETYVISFDLRGGLRTFDDAPELYLDVTGEDYPKIERFTVNVKATGEIPRASCYVGRDTCSADANGDTATFTGTDVPRGDILTVAAALPPTQLGARPDLVPRETDQTFLVSGDSRYEVDARGSTKVTQDLTVHVGRGRFLFEVPVRVKSDFFRDRVLTVSEPVVEDELGQRVRVTLDKPPTGRTSHDVARYEVRYPVGVTGKQRFTLTWTVDGAVHVDGDEARFALPMATMHLSSLPTSESHSWTFPGDVSSVGCAKNGSDEPGPCDEGLGVGEDGATVTAGWTGQRPPLEQWFTVEFPASAVSGVEEKTAFSGDIVIVLLYIAGSPSSSASSPAPSGRATGWAAST